MSTLTTIKVRELFDYDAERGVLTRRGTDQLAGYMRKDGYRQITVGCRNYLAHRVVWLHVYGVWPAKHLDHINGRRDDNRICNLREATRSQNMANRVRHLNNKCGFKGVTFHKGCRKFRAAIRVNGKYLHLGFYENPQNAHAAYVDAARKHFGGFARAS